MLAFQGWRQWVRVLICEDNSMIALMLEGLLEDWGHEPLGPAESFAKAMQAVQAQAPDLALVDLDLTDGRTGLRIIDTLADRGIPGIIVSGHAEHLGPDHRAVGLVRKPINETQLRRLGDSCQPS